MLLCVYFSLSQPVSPFLAFERGREELSRDRFKSDAPIASSSQSRFVFVLDQKRALSRLQEMTNPTLVRQPHVPLCPSLRTWETSTTSSSSGTSSVPTPDRKRFSDKQGDFAEEASFLQRTGGGGGGPRENATKLRSEAHFWGLVTPKDS